MTAFASNKVELDTLTINCEFRSVNHRYCDISLKLPEIFRFLEADIRKSISNQLKRGKIECTLSYKKQLRSGQAIHVNKEAVTALLLATAQIEAQMDAPLSCSALEVLAFPCIQQEPEVDTQLLSKGINALVKKTVKALLLAREREGTQLALLIEQRCHAVKPLLTSANERLPLALEHIKQKIKNRLTELVSDPDFDRLEQEMVYLTQKMDVAEELDRIDTHIQEIQRVLKSDEPVGRRLDFLMQELNREVNTLGSKSADKKMTQISIELKVLIEQMREQVQNIE